MIQGLNIIAMSQVMQKPTSPVRCAPGLEYLAVLDQVIVQQQVELAEAVLGIETSNRYVAKNSTGQFIYNLKEDSSCCAKYCIGANRCFVMDVLDHEGHAVMRFERPLRCVHCCFLCCLQVVEVQAPPGTLIGRVCQLWSICYPSYGIYDTSGNKTLSIVGPCCTYSMPCCCDVQFQVKSANGVEVGKITKQWSGVVKEGFTDADTFGVTFPMDLDVNMKASLIAATMLIDYMFYETTCGQGSGAKAT